MFPSLIFRFKDSNGGHFQDGRDLIEKNLFKQLHKTISCNKPMKISTKVLITYTFEKS